MNLLGFAIVLRDVRATGRMPASRERGELDPLYLETSAHVD